jgi:hypothetical protein
VKNKEKQAGWKNRIVGHGEQPADQFNFNPLNYRLHPPAQREAVRRMRGMVGWVTEVIVNRRTGNLIDGQARIEEALRQDATQKIPFTEVDLSLEEEKAVLATLDPMTGMAETDREVLDDLLSQVRIELPDMDDLLLTLHEDDPPPQKTRTVEFKEHPPRIVIECKNKRHQKELIKRFEAEGLEFQAK